MKPYLNIQEAIRDLSDRIERLEAALNDINRRLDSIGERTRQMALHFDLKVNDQTIGTFYARRLNEGIQEPDSINAYTWTVIEYEPHDQQYSGMIEHRFGDGAWTLVELVLQEVERQKQERIAYSPEA